MAYQIRIRDGYHTMTCRVGNEHDAQRIAEVLRLTRGMISGIDGSANVSEIKPKKAGAK